MHSLLCLALFATLFALLFVGDAIKCVGWEAEEDGSVKLDGLKDEEWWALLKPPKSENYLYVSPTFPNGVYVVGGGRSRLQDLFNAQAKEEKSINKEAYTQYWNSPFITQARPGTPSDHVKTPTGWLQPDFRRWPLEAEAVRNKIKIWQLWFNDQPLTNYGSWGRTEQNVKHLKYGHSKYMLSVSTDSKSGVLLQHSFPATPYLIYDPMFEYTQGLDKWLRSYQIFPKPETKNVFLKAQHAYCISLSTAAEVKSTIQMLIHARPQIVNLNFQPEFLSDNWTLKKDLVSLINSNFVAEKSQGCEQSWSPRLGKMQTSPLKESKSAHWLNSYNNLKFQIYKFSGKVAQADAVAKDFTACTKYLQISRENIMIISHITKTKLKSVNEDKDTGREEGIEDFTNSPDPLTLFRTVTDVGPMPWLTVSQILETRLFVSFWKNDPLPSILAESAGVLTVGDVKFSGFRGLDKDITWRHGQGHEKIAVSADTKKPWVCFGDSNHRPSEITHAGIMDSRLWKTMSDIIQNYLTNDDAFDIGGVWPKTKHHAKDGHYRTLHVAPLRNQNPLKNTAAKEAKKQHREAQVNSTPSRVSFGPPNINRK